jgi:hypothetical protein
LPFHRNIIAKGSRPNGLPPDVSPGEFPWI